MRKIRVTEENYGGISKLVKCDIGDRIFIRPDGTVDGFNLYVETKRDRAIKIANRILCDAQNSKVGASGTGFFALNSGVSCVVMTNKRVHRGESKCREHDVWNEKIGMALAYCRAMGKCNTKDYMMLLESI